MSFQQRTDLATSETAFEETLALLDWERVCDQLSSFASTSQGKKECRTSPIPQDIAISRRYLSETLEIAALDNEIEGRLSLAGVHDLEEILYRCSKGGTLASNELLAVAETLRAARRLRRQIDVPAIRPTMSLLFSNITTLPELQRLIEFGVEESGRIADRASETLSLLRRQINSLRIERRDLLREIIRKNNSSLQDNIISERLSRPVLALKPSAIDQILGTIHDSSASGNTVFIEPKVVIPLGNQIDALEAKIFVEEQRLLVHWSKEVGKNYDALYHLSKILLRLDFALARARYGNWLNGVAPLIEDDSDAPFVIKEFRHPLLVWQAQYEQGGDVVPISFEVSSGVKVVSITGPNTGGKTVALKSFGLALLMAKFGLLLPCVEEPSLPWCDQVFADIGDEQSLQQNLSTFSGHVSRIVRIIHSISRQSGPSIVLLDELGAGTDPTEGTSLAIALLMAFADTARLTIATTHFGELKALKYRDSRFENASVGFDSETMSPTYHLQWGIPGRSNAISIAKRLGLDSSITDRASKLISSSNVENANDIIQGLEQHRQKQQEAAEDTAALLARTELLHEEIISRWKQECRESEDFQEKGRRKLEISILEGQREVKKLIRRLRDQSADGEIARRAGQELKRIKVRNQKDITSTNRNAWSPKEGDRVRLSALGKSAEVIGISEDGLQLTIMCGVFRSMVDLNAVESLDGHKPSVPDSVVNVKANISYSVGTNVRTKKNTIDVRGLRVHEAEAVVEEKLRNANGPLWIIHGIGTGRLKRGLIEWLEGLTYVEKITSADQVDGGPGCSVVWLK